MEADMDLQASQTDLDLQVRRVSGALGAEVRGLDLATLDAEGFARVEALLMQHLVLFFPDQPLNPDQHRDFALRFGEPEIHPFIPKLDEAHPEIVVLQAEAGYIADVWHTDVTFDAAPPKCSVLQTLTLPPAGGDTMWANQYLAYERLSAPIKDMLDGLTAIHTAANYGHPERRAEHPVVRRHPVTGRASLFVNRQFTRRIPQLSRDESEALLGLLYAHSTLPDFTCRYAWSVGTIAIWDNRCTQHYAVNDYEGDRAISRVTILGDAPQPAFDTQRWRPYQAARMSAASGGRDRD
jgi:taurine dioxygenase